MLPQWFAVTQRSAMRAGASLIEINRGSRTVTRKAHDSASADNAPRSPVALSI
jgi:hypothetical protein